MTNRLSLDDMARKIAGEFCPDTEQGDQFDETWQLARALLVEIGVAELLEAVTMTRSIIRFADGFHPVARFFVDGTPEQTFILSLLRDDPD